MSRFILLLCCYLIFATYATAAQANSFQFVDSVLLDYDITTLTMPLGISPDSEVVTDNTLTDCPLPSWSDYRWQIFILVFVFSILLLSNIVLLHSLRRSKKTATAISQERDLLTHCVIERSHELAELRILFKNAAQSAKFGVFDYDLVTGKLTWDESMLDIYGMSYDEFSSAYSAWSNAVLPEDIADVEAALQSAIRGETPFDTHFRIRRGNGEIVSIHAIGQVYRDNEGVPSRIVGVNQIDQAKPVLQEVTRMEMRNFTAQPRHDLAAASSMLNGRKILLVEDNAINRELVTTLLSKLGVIVEVAEDGRRGLQRVASSVFDAVLMDIQMPEMDGITATRLIRADKRFAQLPIIAMTAHTLSGDYEKSLAAGMNDHLVKPVDFAKLTETLNNWLVKSTPPPQSASTVIPASVQIAATDSLPATLPPFDLTAALLRTNGNPKLLHKLIIMFHDNYATATATLRQLLTQQDYVQAERLAHSLKGVAGTLEARELYDAALAVEKAFRNSDTAAATGLIDELDKTLIPAVAAAATLTITAVSTPVIVASTSATAVPDKTIAPLLADLYHHVVHNKLKARKLFAGIAEQLVNCGVDAELAELQTKLENLDFTGALPVLEQLTAKLHLNE